MGTRILLLEDDNFCLRLLETVLAAEGYDVVLCDSPDDVTRRAQNDPSALALVDFWGTSQLTLSDGDRTELVRLTSAVPTVLVTARHWAERSAPYDLGLLAIIIKPFDVDGLCAVVEECVSRSKAGSSSDDQPDCSEACA